MMTECSLAQAKNKVEPAEVEKLLRLAREAQREGSAVRVLNFVMAPDTVLDPPVVKLGRFRIPKLPFAWFVAWRQRKHAEHLLNHLQVRYAMDERGDRPLH